MQRSKLPHTPVAAIPATDASVASRRTLAGYLSILLRGFAMGSADVVPGVSGGTIAFITGIYEELLGSIRMIGRPTFIRAVLGLRIREALALINFPFLVALLAGIAVAVITLAPGIEWLLHNQPILLWSFFFGLVVASVWMVSGKIKRWTLLLWMSLILGTVGAYWLVGLVPTQTPNSWWFLILSGAVAICAMILPGISGSFILVLLSKYQFFVSAVNERDLVSLALAGIGAFVGLVSFAQVLSWLFKRYHDLTVALLTGFMIGSLRKVWPWKEVLETITDRHGELIPIVERNVLPPLTVNGAFQMEIAYALLLAIVGFALVLLIERAANHADSNDRTV
jgi:putative membrane protein